MADKVEEEQAPPKIYTYIDLLKFENPEIYSSFGKMRLSHKTTAPKYGFGTADRNKQAKVFQNKELAKTNFAGKSSPGPAYDVRDTDYFTYQKAPKWKIGSEVRNTLNTGSKHDFYLRKDVDFDPLEADIFRRPKAPTVRIGLELRFPNDPKRHKGTPGPQYNPTLRHEIPNPPKFSFGFRREIQGFSPLVANSSTPQLVGPGSYIQKNVPNTSKIRNEPKWSFPNAERFSGFQADLSNAHYTKPRAIGTQYDSRKQTLPMFSFGKSTRESKRGTFKDMMSTQEVRIRISMPKF
ncbi:sperm-tail PG-rich repeat protein (macronuclear) [Tetrahymena thermophila SB210]|uniref:Sperm-tail PG-rich repeat protein n=1 Tax=Tetrahymena thermophila (strain SB210) TaxID=312017 RepID=I7M2G0_TETTS|nr:sperm-tail PG-rich repeat protein [Tetrahymena thermophila SB210]8G2Z_2I Chain 2I, STPG2 [Tetrahymena thermophila CU428]8G2Z_3I Chain 3I, STPG2 [Tetrahymena thermophila CU428]8G3D_2I Chain 2I, STPG2 [Tetrahymena thermophila]8G3D_3I Chain 3I, STPG2 [Tetrahymena thermophila]EAS00318.1 sperm-tail PG-rich repeat protein [Tetrahymena thermophila SB210]|eukprot:XP_001020563.1 sperm-tail PG-rich repeat protein [Tetrahymena thermophila SB210]